MSVDLSAYPAWPVSLPVPVVDAAGFEPAQDNWIKTQFPGAEKRRRRFTNVATNVTFLLWNLDRAQLQTLLDFYRITLGEVGAFRWIDPRKPADGSNVVLYEFRNGEPAHQPIGGDKWQATLELRLLTTFQGTFLTDIEGIST